MLKKINEGGVESKCSLDETKCNQGLFEVIRLSSPNPTVTSENDNLDFATLHQGLNSRIRGYECGCKTT